MGLSVKFDAWNHLFPKWPNFIRIPASLDQILGASPRSEDELGYAVWCDRQSKIELHVHMEAAVSHSFYQRLNQVSKKFSPDDLPSTRAPFSDFRQFIKAWIDHTLLIDNLNDISTLCVDFFETRKLLNIVYTETHISPLDFSVLRSRFGLGGRTLDFKSVVLAYLEGIRMNQDKYPGHIVRLIVDCEWISNADEQNQLLDILTEIVPSNLNMDSFGDQVLLGVGLGGAEISSKAKDFLPFIERCREMGLKIDIHSGEMSSSAEHRHSVQTLRPDRVGHGIKGGVMATMQAVQLLFVR